MPGLERLKVPLIFLTCSGGRAAPPLMMSTSEDRSRLESAAAACSSADMVGTPLNQVMRSSSIRRSASWGSHLCMITSLRPMARDIRNTE